MVLLLPRDDLAAAAVAGLVRSAQTEHPDRLVLVHCDPADPVDLALVPAAVASGEPELAVESGRLRAPASCRPFRPRNGPLSIPPAPFWSPERAVRWAPS
ncbi:hypothetical protein ACFQ2Y_00795 [Streptomyces malaysiensis subsp. malaysiensis]